MDANRKPISSHIFIFPFRWDYISGSKLLQESIDKRLNVNRVVEILNNDTCWKEDKPDIENEDDEYNKYAYFYDNVRDAIYGKDKYINLKRELYYKFSERRNFLFREVIKKDTTNRIVQCFKYDKIDNSTYDIEIFKKEKNRPCFYSLNIKDIKLKIYDTGVASLSFFLENYNQKSNPEDIFNINDYGRRIFPQYLPLEKVQDSFLAKKISLNFPHKKIEEEFKCDVRRDKNRISNTIMDLLGNKFKYNREKLKKGEVFISPIIDDRMFTLCIYRNNTFSRLLTNYNKNRYLESEFWYKYVFIDNSYVTCQDADMKKNLLNNSTYTRWKNCGTLYGITRYSFVVIVNEEDFAIDVLFKHFNNMYYEMALITLIERASILRISDEASKIACLNEDEALENIKKLQRYYIEFINDLYFREVTAQEQGIEMYDKLMEMMKIERDIKRLGEEIDGIHKYTSMISNEKLNNFLRVITYLGIGFTVCNFVIGLYTKKLSPTSNFNIIQLGKFTVWPILGLIVVLIIVDNLSKSGKIKILYKVVLVIVIVLAIILFF